MSRVTLAGALAVMLLVLGMPAPAGASSETPIDFHAWRGLQGDFADGSLAGGARISE